MQFILSSTRDDHRHTSAKRLLNGTVSAVSNQNVNLLEYQQVYIHVQL